MSPIIVLMFPNWLIIILTVAKHYGELLVGFNPKILLNGLNCGG